MTRIEVTDGGAVARASAYEFRSLPSRGAASEGAIGVLPNQAPERPTPTCLLCGNPGIEGNELGLTTLGFDFVSDAFPAHRHCVQQYEYDRAVDHMMREALEW